MANPGLMKYKKYEDKDFGYCKFCIKRDKKTYRCHALTVMLGKRGECFAFSDDKDFWRKHQEAVQRYTQRYTSGVKYGAFVQGLGKGYQPRTAPNEPIKPPPPGFGGVKPSTTPE